MDLFVCRCISILHILCSLCFPVFSHLQGLFYRTIRMSENGVKPVFVFDGKPPQLKAGEVSLRWQ